MLKKVIIIGAGLTGLSAGIHLRKNGVETEIFELSGQAGGMCTTWVRDRYRFDGCIEWMVGTQPGSGIYKLYREVDALLENTPIYSPPSTNMDVNGRTYTVPLTFEGFKSFLLDLSPEDSLKTTELCNYIDIMMKCDLIMGRPSGFIECIKFLTKNSRLLRLSAKLGKLSVRDFTEGYKSSTIKAILHQLMSAEYAFFALIMMLGTRMTGNAGYPLGGSLGVVRRMERKYSALSGQLHFNTRVDRIVIENHRVTGVIAKGVFYKADAVIAACDMYDTLHRMLGGSYRHPQLDTLLESAGTFHPLAVVSFGLNKQLGLPFATDLECPEGIRTAPDLVIDRLRVRAFDFDPAAAPQGCSSVVIYIPAPLDYWQKLRDCDIEQYRIMKARLAEEIKMALDKRIPGFAESVRVTDVATPATYIRYANLYKGSFEGFEPTPDVLSVNIKKTIKGLKGLVLAGQWTTAGGGLCTAVYSGKEAAYRIIKGS